MKNGNFVLILHTHLPWVLNHGKWPHGEDWLTEAIAECYIPLLNILNELLNEGITPKITFDISPVLCEQLANENIKLKFIEYCDSKIKLASDDEKRFAEWNEHPHKIYMAGYWKHWYSERKSDFINKYDSNIIGALKKLQDIDAIEIMTCGATHGYFPLLGLDRSINLQMKVAKENYYKHFGRYPKGTWLPECAYRPEYDWKSMIPVAPFNDKHHRKGVESFLQKQGIDFFVVDEPLTTNGEILGYFADVNNDYFLDSDNHDKNHQLNALEVYNVASSKYSNKVNSINYTRHQELTLQVWSGQIGYPAEPNYLDFHKKQDKSMLRYWRVTDAKADMADKDFYHPDWTNKNVDLQANHFIHHLENTVNHFNKENVKVATLCTPFDTELFGHWWFEGPQFIKALIKGLHFSPYIKCTTASENLEIIKPKTVISIPEGSWGENNNHDVWSNPSNYWTWEKIYNCENRFETISKIVDFRNTEPVLNRILLQTLRELMLLQSSDWQFLITNESAKDYSEMRFEYHYSDFNILCDMAYKRINDFDLSDEDEIFIENTENRNCIFPELRLDWWYD
ncbi:MAG: DUF1957 domain-containing protein [Candidatus Kapabacteria bacterium]|nr:DUF1957 domain-containing protein [Candidatus Kapabacteria bacterium]